MFFKIGALKNFAKVKHLCWSLFLIKIKKKEAPTQLFSWEHCKIVKNSFLHRATTTSSGCFYQFGKVASCSVLGICRPSLINQNLNVGLFLLKRFVHLYRACSLHIISRNYSRFCWLTCRKQILVQSKTLQQRLFVLIPGFWQFRQVFVHYLTSILTICK